MAAMMSGGPRQPMAGDAAHAWRFDSERFAERSISEPLAPQERIVEVDVVRGFALFGVLLVNMYGFGADSIAWTSIADRTVSAVTHVLFEDKSWTLFSMFFGFGFALQLERLQARGRPVFTIYLRRLAILFALGVAHALLFDGDILMLYAELGLGLLLLHRLPSRVLLGLAAALMLVFPVLHFRSPPDAPAEATAIETARAQLEEAGRVDVYAVGSLAAVVKDNLDVIPTDPRADLAAPESSLAVLAMFLVGFVCGRSGILRDIPALAGSLARLRAWGLGLGLGAMVAEWLLRAGPAGGKGTRLAADLLLAFGVPLLALGYAASLILAVQTPRGRAVLGPLAGVGRMSLTVYLTQTLMFTTLFYGYGFGQVFRLGPVAVTGWAVLFFAIQIVVCRWWTSRFRFGPVEWLWRSLTYLKWQPLRQVPPGFPRRSPSADASP
jgi:uncharacterized protein